jgi:ribosomal protein L11 methyltransferase
MDDSYIELEVYTKEEFVELLADFISTVTGEAVEIGKDRVILRTTEDTSSLEAQLDALRGEIDLNYKKSIKKNIDWIEKYKNSIEPIEAGEFYIHPSWHSPKDGKINIVINPALAFGSGHHATTFSSLEAISNYVKEGDTLLDVGCGSGILALAAAFKGATVDLCDTDPLAVESAKENFLLNNQKYRDIWVGSANKTNKKYDIVVANIIADVLIAIKDTLKSKLKDGSILILSGILDKKERGVLEAYSDLKNLKKIEKDEWITLILKKDNNG